MSRCVAMKPPFDDVVRTHGATVLRVCRAVVGPHDADDAWSETFLAAMRHYPRLPDDANTRAWLVTIAHRKSIDITRARKRRPIAVDEVPECADTTAGAEGHAELWRAVERLPLRQRQAVAYRYLGGLAYKDIAALMGGTDASVRRAAADGVAALRAAFNAASNTGATR